VQEKEEEDVLTKMYFPRAHTEERKQLETGLITA
jgi:hypothetical protein